MGKGDGSGVELVIAWNAWSCAQGVDLVDRVAGNRRLVCSRFGELFIHDEERNGFVRFCGLFGGHACDSSRFRTRIDEVAGVVDGEKGEGYGSDGGDGGSGLAGGYEAGSAEAGAQGLDSYKTGNLAAAEFLLEGLPEFCVRPFRSLELDELAQALAGVGVSV